MPEQPTQIQPSKTNKLYDYITLFVTFVLVVGGFVLLKYWPSNSETTQVQKIQQKIDDIQKKLDPYTQKEDLKRSTIVSGFKNTTKDNKQTDSFNKVLNIQGQFSAGYFYVRASVNDKALTMYDDVYIKLTSNSQGQYVESGGHLLENKSLETPKFDKYSELLFDLRDVRFKNSYKDSEVNSVSADWLKILNGGKTDIVIGFSSTAGQGNIEEMNIFYQCINGSDCSIE